MRPKYKRELKARQKRWKRYWRKPLTRHGRRDDDVWAAIEGLVPPQGNCPLSRYNSSAEVYVCEEGGRHKIGVGFYATSRMMQIANDTGLSPRLIATVACSTRDLAETIEKYLHWLLRAYRWDGEWFVLPAETIVLLRASYLVPGKPAVAAISVFDEETMQRLVSLFDSKGPLALT